ncbi:TMV resistance protein N-like [Gossypium australe]|uniref:TMV resistance protein N-like n=1 Tax=Gossypium australe TaxID=47621 RepID=A0A5B6WQM5_9ROSI|nr:TMV resistance protein N-like [Gossypium australe]
MIVINSIRLLGEDISDNRVVEVITTLPERYEYKISSLEDSRDLSAISLPEFINGLYAQEKRRALRREEHAKKALRGISIEGRKNQKHKGKKGWTEKKKKSMQDGGKKKYSPCSHCKKNIHPEKYYWKIYKIFVLKVRIGNDELLETKGKDEVVISSPSGKKKQVREEVAARMEVRQVHEGNFISQQSFALKILKRFYMEKCKLIGTLVALGEKLNTMKRVLRYIKGTTYFSVWFVKANTLKLVGYTNSDWARLVDDMLKQPKFYVTTISAIAVAKNPVFQGKTKHFKMKYYFVREVE